MADIKKSLGEIFLVVGIVMTIGAGIGFFIVFMGGWSLSFKARIERLNIPTISSVILVIGLSILVVGIILRKLAKKSFLDSISQSDLINMFDCPSGKKGAIHLIKLVKDQILVKQSCPNPNPYGWTSKVRLLRIPLRLKNQCASYFRDAVFRCYKCGQEATVDHVKFSGPWTLIKLSCPTHGNNLPYHKIWSTVYSDISNGVDTIP